MNVDVSEITEKKMWNTFVAKHGPKSGAFLQSWEWGEFQKKFGRKIWRLGIMENTVLAGTAQIIKCPLPFRRSYLYCPRGPIINSELRITDYELLIEKIKETAQKENTIFFRCEPTLELQATSPACPAYRTGRRQAGYKLQKTTPIQPPQTLLLDLTKSEGDLLAAMHHKTRYNIRLAERHGIAIHRTRLTDPEMLKEDFEIFWNLLSKTSGRDGFRPHPKNYYWQILNTLIPQPAGSTPTPNVALYSAKYQNKTLATNLIMFFGETVTYLHGASSEEDRNVMAPYLLHWHIIKEAKRLGYKFYDFWGIDETKWPGVTRFKKGFSGIEVAYLGTFDLPINKTWHKIYCLAKKIL